MDNALARVLAKAVATASLVQKAGRAGMIEDSPVETAAIQLATALFILIYDHDEINVEVIKGEIALAQDLFAEIAVAVDKLGPRLTDLEEDIANNDTCFEDIN